MNELVHSFLLVAVISAVTVAIRFLPFLIFHDSSRTPKALEYLGGVLPGATMGMLVVYCFKGTAVTAWPFALPELIATAAVVGLYLWKRNTLLSIGAGTILYMVLVQTVFL